MSRFESERYFGDDRYVDLGGRRRRPFERGAGMTPAGAHLVAPDPWESRKENGARGGLDPSTSFEPDKLRPTPPEADGRSYSHDAEDDDAAGAVHRPLSHLDEDELGG